MQPVVCLLIDDDTEESEIFQYAIEDLKLPVECHLATSGKQAIEYLIQTSVKPDYIFLDLNMPKMDGRQCLQAIRNLDICTETNIILYSNFFHADQKRNLEAIGADGFITKTTSILELNSELSRLFKGSLPNNDEELPSSLNFIPLF